MLSFPHPSISLLPREIKVLLNSFSTRLALEKWYQFLGDKKKIQCYFLVFEKEVQIQHLQKTYQHFPDNLNKIF